MPGARDRVRSEQSLLDTAEIQSKSSPMGSGGAPVAPSSDFGRRVVCALLPFFGPPDVRVFRLFYDGELGTPS